MDGLTDARKLLVEAQAAGLTVSQSGDKLVIRGPKSAGGMARRLLDRKTEIIAVLADGGDTICSPVAEDSVVSPSLAESVVKSPPPSLPEDSPFWYCPKCDGILWWEDGLGRWHCLVCEAAGHERCQRLAERAARLRREAEKQKRNT